ncbi:hypothetical protein TYRP_022866 [Tyrophagus putrescentiae]|nr:hypothetical protein TYRP_022866 [Tyrophagus putrescentiae]
MAGSGRASSALPFSSSSAWPASNSFSICASRSSTYSGQRAHFILGVGGGRIVEEVPGSWSEVVAWGGGENSGGGDGIGTAAGESSWSSSSAAGPVGAATATSKPCWTLATVGPAAEPPGFSADFPVNGLLLPVIVVVLVVQLVALTPNVADQVLHPADHHFLESYHLGTVLVQPFDCARLSSLLILFFLHLLQRIAWMKDAIQNEDGRHWIEVIGKEGMGSNAQQHKAQVSGGEVLQIGVQGILQRLKLLVMVRHSSNRSNLP